MERLTGGKRQKKRGARKLIVLLVLLAVVLVAAVPVIDYIEKRSYPLQYEELVEQYSAEFGVDRWFVFAVIRTESGFDPAAESEVGARGLMQMMEDTFDWLKPKIAPDEDLTFEDLYSPPVSIRFGVYFLSLCLQRYGNDMATAAAAYHSGWGTVDSLLEDGENTENGVTLSSFPRRQMAHYVDKVLNSYNKYVEIYEQAE